jgi:sugar phosphate isomerase/epimerase
VPAAARDLVGAASRGLADAALAEHPRQQYALAHLAALRAAAAVLACHARPTRRRGPRSAWELLSMVAPDLSEWAAFFAAGAAKRSAAEAGLGHITPREAADLIREAECFLDLVCTRLEVSRQPGLAALRCAG